MNVDLAVKNAKLVSPRGIVEAGVAVKNGVVVAVAAVRALFNPLMIMKLV